MCEFTRKLELFRSKGTQHWATKQQLELVYKNKNFSISSAATSLLYSVFCANSTTCSFSRSASNEWWYRQLFLSGCWEAIEVERRENRWKLNAARNLITDEKLSQQSRIDSSVFCVLCRRFFSIKADKFFSILNSSNSSLIANLNMKNGPFYH